MAGKILKDELSEEKIKAMIAAAYEQGRKEAEAKLGKASGPSYNAPVEDTFETKGGKKRPTLRFAHKSSTKTYNAMDLVLGVEKCHAIVQHVDAIRAFTKKHPSSNS